MADIDSTIQQVMRYLRVNEVLNGNPIFESTVTEFVPIITPKAYWDEYYMTRPYWGDQEVEFHKAGFDAIDSELKRTNLWKVQEDDLKEIPDSKDTVIIELGSGYGFNGAGYTAAQKKSTRAILISKAWDEKGPAEYLFFNPSKPIPRVVFTKGRHLLSEKNLETRVNGLYKANDIKNVRFYEHTLTLDEVENQLPPFLQGLAGKNIYLIGRQAPKTLPFLIGKLYNRINARSMSVSLTAQEKTRPWEFSWSIIQKNLGLTDEELQGFIASTHDPEAIKVKHSLSFKYNYEEPAEMRVGVMIKFAIALALAKEVNGKILRDDGIHYHNYNKTDHYVQARR